MSGKKFNKFCLFLQYPCWQNYTFSILVVTDCYTLGEYTDTDCTTRHTCSQSVLTLSKIPPQTNTFTSTYIRMSWGTGGHTRESAKPPGGQLERACRPSLSFKLLIDAINLKLRCLRIKLRCCNLPSTVGPFDRAGLKSPTL